MAAGLHANMALYNAEFAAGYWEALARQLQAFNAASNGGIVLRTNQLRGYYDKRSFFSQVASVVSRRDLTDASAASDLTIAQAEEIGVKLFRKYGPAAVALGAVKTAGSTQADLVSAAAGDYAQQKMKAWLDSALIAGEAGIQGQAAFNLDATALSSKTLESAYLAKALAKMGDQATQVVCWVMHSKPYFDLVQAQISENVVNVADAVLYGGSPATFGRPVVVTDSAALTDANGSLTDTYNVLGLTRNGIVVTESEEDTIFADVVSGLGNLIWRMQAEFSFNVGVKGLKWDIGNVGANPTDGNLGTTTSWDLSATDFKSGAGVRILCQ